MLIGRLVRRSAFMVGAMLYMMLVVVAPVSAAIPPPGPKEGAGGIQGTVATPPPTQGATITTPTNGQSFTNLPITVSGLCKGNVLVKVFSNNVFVGSAQCINGSYTLQIDLFEGRNDLIARVYDALDQAGPDSNTVTVTYNNPQLARLGGSALKLSSVYALRGADPGQQITWPISVSGGSAPYALSMDWGDSKAPTLMSAQFAGVVNMTHVYDRAGQYAVIVKATDKDGQIAFLQLVGQANGAVGQSTEQDANQQPTIVQKFVWWPIAATVPLFFVTFWLGKKHELSVLRRHLEQGK